MESRAKAIFRQFMEEKWQNSYGQRDNCGPAALDLKDYFSKKGIESKRVFGEFICDNPVHEKGDFTKEMRQEFEKTGLDFDSKEDRLSWVKESSYYQEWLKCPHYWVQVGTEIFDPSGESQFLDSGLAEDLNWSRYIEKNSEA